VSSTTGSSSTSSPSRATMLKRQSRRKFRTPSAIRQHKRPNRKKELSPPANLVDVRQHRQQLRQRTRRGLERKSEHRCTVPFARLCYGGRTEYGELPDRWTGQPAARKPTHGRGGRQRAEEAIERTRPCSVVCAEGIAAGGSQDDGQAWRGGSMQSTRGWRGMEGAWFEAV
jgi:hypothetical protein